MREADVTEELVKEGLKESLNIDDAVKFVQDEEKMWQLMKWFNKKLKERNQDTDSLERLEDVRHFLSDPLGLVHCSWMVALKRKPTIFEYIGLTRMPYKYSRDLAHHFGRDDWIKRYLNSGDRIIKKRERNKARKR